MPYGIDKKIGGDSEQNVSWMERCVGKISGTNKRTGKPYTKGEKIAICKSQMKKNKSKSSESVEIDADAATEVEEVIFNFANKLLHFNRAPTSSDAYWLAQSYLQMCNYDIELLKMVEIK